ncbi:MAG: Gfo/Idh/MocA family oxidoreductase [Phycisphaeraceae bacterium]
MTARIAFLSTAHIHTDAFIKHLTSSDVDATVTAIWDDTPQRGQKYADQADARFIDNIDNLLADDQIDAFVICDANTRHTALLEKALPVGKPVFCEKPITTSLADAQCIARLIKRHNTPLCSGYFFPFFAENQAVQQAVRAGTFGRITHAFVRNSHHACYGRWFDSPDLQWFTQPELSGGGALMDMGAHAVHWLIRLCGPVASVWGDISNITSIYPDVDDYGVIHMNFADNIIGRAEASWVQHSSNSGLELWGTEAALSYIDGQPHAVTSNQKPTPLPKAEALPDRMERLLAIVEQRLDPAEVKEDLVACLNEVAVMDAAYRSAERGTSESVARIEI